MRKIGDIIEINKTPQHYLSDEYRIETGGETLVICYRLTDFVWYNSISYEPLIKSLNGHVSSLNKFSRTRFHKIASVPSIKSENLE